jgi:hypothetical protein
MSESVASAGPTSELVRVRIVGLPVAVWQRASEHGDELMREFALIAAGADEDPAWVPARLTTLVDELRSRFSGFTLRQEAELAEAVARGETTVDLEYTVPRDVVPAVTHLGDLLDEADEFCRGDDLLTLATPPEALAFRRWFLDEFVRQAGGQPPRPWSDWMP